MLKKTSSQNSFHKSLPIVDLALRWMKESSNGLPRSIFFNTDDEKNSYLIEDKYKRFYPGGNYFGVYLTEQEARCLYYFMQGLTNAEVSAVMGISAKTVSFYSCNIRLKIPCRSRKELIAIMSKTDFINYMEELEKLEANLKREFKLAAKAKKT